MAYKIVKRDVNLNQVGTEITAVLDAAEDLDSLGTNWAPGSTAIVVDKGAPVYMLNASHVWKEI